MNKEKLIIKNFGPIKSVDLDLGKITVLIGEQATGKSTIAKVLSMCRYFSYIVNYRVEEVDKQGDFHINIQFIDGLRDWGIDSYLSDNSEIIYENLLYKFEYKNEQKEVDYTRVSPTNKDNSFFKLLTQLKELKKDETEAYKDDSFAILDWTPNENFYRLNVKKVMDNPLFIPTERVAQSLSGTNSLVSKAIQDELIKINRIVRSNKKETQIEPLLISYKNINGLGYVKKDKEKSFYNLYNGASGYQSTIPIVLAIKYYTEIEKRKRTFIVEEPEQNLFPKAQKKLIEFFAESVTNFDNQFLLPTHSPYILSTLSNLIYAHKIGTSKGAMFEKEVNDIIPKESWIDVKDISVYNLGNGYAENLVDIDECIINLEYIDSVSKFLNSDFDKILKVDIALEKAIS